MRPEIDNVQREKYGNNYYNYDSLGITIQNHMVITDE
jgi:hypothetical protein